eukprot:scaffold178798_cov36-Tisochrysis_lutea.AAC.3
MGMVQVVVQDDTVHGEKFTPTCSALRVLPEVMGSRHTCVMYQDKASRTTTLRSLGIVVKSWL